MSSQIEPRQPSRPGRELALASGLAVILGLIQTSPLWRYLASGIPHAFLPHPGWERVPLLPGDHLQFFYWCWLLVDNLAGPSALFSNPYEFNTFLSAGLPGFANFPFSLIYAALYPLGPILAYNLMVLLTYALCGGAMFLLARQALGAGWPALVAAMAFALLPFRAAQFLSGHLYGFVAFLLPLCLWCLERGLRRRAWGWGLGAGLCLVAMSLMEGHLVYYSALLIGAYLPLRIILDPMTREGSAFASGLDARAAWAPLAAGAALGLVAHLALARSAGAAVWSPELVVSCLAWMLMAAAFWALSSWLGAGLTSLGPAEASRLVARGFWPFLLSPLYALQYLMDIPHLGGALALVLGLAALGLALPGLWRARRWPGIAGGVWGAAIAVLAGLGAAAGYMMYIKSKVFNDSIAGQGRGLHEVRLFSPRLEDLFAPDNIHTERLIYLGAVLLLLALAALALLVLGRGGRRAPLAALWGFGGLTALLLSLGPSFSHLPLFGALYKHLPFFNFPRVPGRLVLFAALLLFLCSAWAFKILARPLLRTKAAGWALALLLCGVIAWDFIPGRPVGICLLPNAPRLAAGVTQNLPTGPDAAQRLLGLPIWPGDSHQSSAYEYLISRTRAKMINGYSPVVPRAYVERIYKPLEALNYGHLTKGALDTLTRLKTGLMAFFDDEHIYPWKISPFPPALARMRLMAAPGVTLKAQAGNVFFLGLSGKAAPSPPPADITSPVTSLWEAEWLPRQTGRPVDDKAASGWGQMFAEPPTPTGPLGPRNPRWQGNVVKARAGRDQPGFLSYGPYKAYPAGKYLARFRLRRGPGGDPGWVDIASHGGKTILARRQLGGAVLPADGAWHDVSFTFELKALTGLELRTYFAGRADLELDAVLVQFASRVGDMYYPAAQLWRQTGELYPDPRLPGGQAVLAKKGYHPPLYIMHGPQRTLEPGRYRAWFKLAAPRPVPEGALMARLVAATDQGRRVLGHRVVKGRDLARDYRGLPVEFTLDRRCELGFRVLFGEGGDLLLAGVRIEPLP